MNYTTTLNYKPPKLNVLCHQAKSPGNNRRHSHRNLKVGLNRGLLRHPGTTRLVAIGPHR